MAPWLALWPERLTRLLSQVQDVIGNVLLCRGIGHDPGFTNAGHLQTTDRTVPAAVAPAEGKRGSPLPSPAGKAFTTG